MEEYLRYFRESIIEEARCPECLGRLDDEWVCQRCGYDAWREYGRGCDLTEEDVR